MQIVARSINDTNAERLANHFAILPPRPALKGSLVPLDSKLYGACVECHGISGDGTGFGPRIAGQQPEYTYQQLLQYKSGIRVQPEMEVLLDSVQDYELKALADYLGTLRRADSPDALNHEVARMHNRTETITSNPTPFR